MPAFNARLKPKMIFGFPLTAIIGFIVALASGLLTFLLPMMLLNVLTGILFVYGLVLAIVSMVYGENLKFLSIKRLSRQDRKSGTIEVMRHE